MQLCKELPYKPNSDNSLVMGLLGSSKAIKFLPVAAEPLIFPVTIVMKLFVFKTTVERGLETEPVKNLQCLLFLWRFSYFP